MIVIQRSVKEFSALWCLAQQWFLSKVILALVIFDKEAVPLSELSFGVTVFATMKHGKSIQEFRGPLCDMDGVHPEA